MAWRPRRLRFVFPYLFCRVADKARSLADLLNGKRGFVTAPSLLSSGDSPRRREEERVSQTHLFGHIEVEGGKREEEGMHCAKAIRASSPNTTLIYPFRVPRQSDITLSSFILSEGCVIRGAAVREAGPG